MNEALQSIKAGLEQAVKHASGEAVAAKVRTFTPLDVKAIRAQVGMSQTQFARSFGISVGTLRHWEQGDREPQGPARVLLNVLAKEPEAVLNALQGET